MLVKSWHLRAILCLALFLGIEAEVSIENNAYQNVVVSFSSKLSPEDGNRLVESMQAILNEASSVLHTAIGLRIGSVTFRLPQSWNASSWSDVGFISSSNADDPDIQVTSLTDSAFGKHPIALQYGVCGVPGLEISIPNEYLLSEDEQFPKGKVLAREWLKYRYGVFDENGFIDDPMYPTHYTIPGSDEIHVTDCTFPKIGYSFRDSENNSCVLTAETATNCSILPHKEDLEGANSSLMFYHEKLQQLDHVCGKEGQTHNVASLNKQNLICSYRSIWEILESSEDIKSIQASNDAADVEIKYSFVQESDLRLVVAWQDTKSLFKQGKSIIKVVQKMLYDIPLNSKVALYNFKGDTSLARMPFSKLDETTRKGWTAGSNFGSTEEGKPLIAVNQAVDDLQADDGKDKPGKIVLFTDSNPAEDSDLVKKLKDSKLCLHIIGLKGTNEEAWNQLLEVSPCSSFLEIPDSDDDVKMYENLYSAIEPILPMLNDTKTYTISTEMLAHDGTKKIPADPTAKTFTVWIFHEVELECSMNQTSISLNQTSVNLTREVDSQTLTAYSFEAQNDEVECRMKDLADGSFLVHVQMTTKEGEYLNNKVWFQDTTPSDSEEQKPYIIYARIFYGEYPVRDADVQAKIVSPNGVEVSLTLVDNGRGEPDLTQNDGIYSRYFVKFDSEGTYRVTVTATNKGQANASRNGQDSCCGSVVVGETVAVSEFLWTHESSFHVSKNRTEKGYPPSRVTDLRVDTLNLPDSLTLKWTAPGDELDEGKAHLYVVKSFTTFEDIFRNFDNENSSIQDTKPVAKKFGEMETFEVKLDDFDGNQTYFIALQSKRENGLASDPSNIVTIVLPVDKIDDKVTAEPPAKRTGLKPETIGLIVGLILLAVVIVILVYLVVYFTVLKPKRKEEGLESRGRTTSSQRSNARTTGLNSIPADVILKHHSEVVNAKSLHKDPPIFNEDVVEMRQTEPNNESPEAENNNRNYAVPSRTFQGDPKISPKRMTVV